VAVVPAKRWAAASAVRWAAIASSRSAGTAPVVPLGTDEQRLQTVGERRDGHGVIVLLASTVLGVAQRCDDDREIGKPGRRHAPLVRRARRNEWSTTAKEE
jgi:hypothetical protein